MVEITLEDLLLQGDEAEKLPQKYIGHLHRKNKAA
jgi:hypothetical protein